MRAIAIPGAPRDASNGAVYLGGGGSDTVTTAPPSYITDAHQQNIGLANTVAAQPYQPYTGPRIAGFTPTQTVGQGVIGGAASVPANFLQNGFGHGVAQGVANYDVGQIKDADLGAYMNPFTQSVIDTTASQINRQNQLALNNVGSQALSQGAYGGSRQGVAQAETNRGYADTLANTTANLNLQNFNQAQNAAAQDINFGLQGQQLKLGAANQMMNSANARNNALLNQQGYDMTRGEALLGIGAQQQGLNQANLDLAYQDFLRQQGYPTEMLNLRQSILSGAPYAQTQTQPGASGLQQGLGAVVGATGLYKGLTGGNLLSDVGSWFSGL